MHMKTIFANVSKSLQMISPPERSHRVFSMTIQTRYLRFLSPLGQRFVGNKLQNKIFQNSLCTRYKSLAADSNFGAVNSCMATMKSGPFKIFSTLVNKQNQVELSTDTSPPETKLSPKKSRKPKLDINENVLVIGHQQLGLTMSRCETLVKRYPQFKNLSTETFFDRLEFLQNKNVSKSRIHLMPWVIFIKSEILDIEVKKISKLLKLNYEIAVPLVSLSSDCIQLMEHTWSDEQSTEPELQFKYKNRINYMADRLNCSPAVISDMIGKTPRLAVLEFQKVREVIGMLLEGGVAQEDIVSDPWCFLHNIQAMKERLKVAHEHKLVRIKPWLLRCSSASFQVYVSRADKERELLLGHPNVASFLQARLSCTEKDAALIMERVSTIKTATATKLNEMIEFLFSKGCTTEDILRVPRILAHSKETVETRMDELVGENCVLTHGLAVYCVANKKWESFMYKVRKDEKSNK